MRLLLVGDREQNHGNTTLAIIGVVPTTLTDEVTFMKTTSAEPDTVPVPTQDLEACSRFVGKDERCALVPRCVKCLLNVLRQGVDAAAHINGFDRQEQVLRL